MKRWERHVARMGRRERGLRDLVGKSEGKRTLRTPKIDGKIILRWIFRNCEVGEWTGLIWLRIGTGGGHL